MKPKIAAGIVTYNPDVERLKMNVEAIFTQVCEVVIVDNASKNLKDIKILAEKFGVKLSCNEKNKGLAAALNDIFRNIDADIEWILTLDQDSVCPDDYIEKCCRYTNEKVGIISAPYFEKNVGKVLGQNRNELVSEVKRDITSGALVNRRAYLKTSGYDEFFNIDYVDFDFSVRVVQAGFKILRMNDVLLEHELGISTIRRFLFWKIRCTEHSAEREYMIARNIVIFVRRYYKTINVIRDILSLIKHFFIVSLYDEAKIYKLKSLIKGVRDGLLYGKA